MTTLPEQKSKSVSVGSIGGKIPWLSWGCLLLAGVIVFLPLTYVWDYLPDYAFGWWVPLLALFLLSERWAVRPTAEVDEQRSTVIPIVIVWALLFLGIRLALEVSLGTRFLLWSSALLYVGMVLFWFRIYGGVAWARHFVFPVCFLLLSVPWPVVIEDPIVHGLARFNASIVANVLVDVGISAQNNGNVIALPNCTLDVKEACSGLRSLQAALMISFLVGELYRLTWLRRGGIVLLAVGLALFGNFSRTLFLSLLASWYGVNVMERWHDTAGASILIFTSTITWLTAHLLHLREKRATASQKTSLADKVLPPERPALRLACGILVGVVLAEALTQGWFAWQEKSVAHYPMWTVVFPSTGNFQELAIPQENQKMLRYDAGREVAWQDEQGWQWTAYWFRYHPKPWGDDVFIVHNPDICLPAAGFEKVADETPFVAEVHGLKLEVFPKQFSWNGQPVYVFWLAYADLANFPLETAMGKPLHGFRAKLHFYLSSIRKGMRSSTAQMESLETIISGPADYPAAQAGYLQELQKIIVPDDRMAKGE